MKNLALVRRYTQGLVSAVEDEAEFAVLHRQLDEFQNLLLSQRALGDLLVSRFIPLARRIEVMRDVLDESGMEDKAKRFLLLLLEKGRLELLPEILAVLPVFWNEAHGVSTFEVASVVPLKENQKQMLAQKLERLEGKPVDLTYRQDPELIGGLTLRRKNVVYDVSIRGQLERIKEIISEG